MANVVETPFAPAVIVAVCDALTAVNVVVKVAVVADAATVTVEGTVAARLLLARAIVKPPDGAAWVKVTVQVSVPEPVKLAVLQARVLNVAVDGEDPFEPLPWSLTFDVLVCGWPSGVAVTVPPGSALPVVLL